MTGSHVGTVMNQDTTEMHVLNYLSRKERFSPSAAEVIRTGVQ